MWCNPTCFSIFSRFPCPISLCYYKFSLLILPPSLYICVCVTDLFISILCSSSYPRTESTAYPSSFDFRGALGALANNPIWGNHVQTLLADGYHKPKSGTDAGDHPPITPMRSASEDMLGSDAWKLYQYVCQHFLGTLSPDCKYRR